MLISHITMKYQNKIELSYLYSEKEVSHNSSNILMGPQEIKLGFLRYFYILSKAEDPIFHFVLDRQPLYY